MSSRACRPRRRSRGSPEDEVAQQQAPVRVRVGAHPSIAGRRLSGQLGQQPAVLVEELLGPVAAHPLLEPASLVFAVPNSGERNLVRPPRSLDRNAVDLSRAGPALRRPEDEHRPARPLEAAALPRRCLDLRDRVERAVERGGEALVHQRRIPHRRSRPRRGSGPSRSPRRAPGARARGSARAPSGSRSSSRSDAGSAERHRRVRGLRNLFECQLAASGPVSASPSPTTQATSRSGLSKAAPKACTSA